MGGQQAGVLTFIVGGIGGLFDRLIGLIGLGSGGPSRLATLFLFTPSTFRKIEAGMFFSAVWIIMLCFSWLFWFMIPVKKILFYLTVLGIFWSYIGKSFVNSQ